VDLDVIEQGTGRDLVVFVHGVLDRGRSFDRVVELLTDECRCLTYDRRGYGSSVDKGEPPDVAVHIADLVEILDGREATLVGHSFGGVTALGAALHAPELVEAVVLYETGMAWVPGWDDTVMSELLWREDAAAAGARMFLGERLDAMPAAQRARWLVEARAFVVEERSVRTGRAPFDVGALDAPLVYGKSDVYPMKGVAEHLMQVVGRCEIVTIAGAGHNAHRTAPEAFADLVRTAMALRA
jgi:pimeloyl-ACP methyl ester carboxylesterase